MEWSPALTEAFSDYAEHIHVIVRLDRAIRYARFVVAASPGRRRQSKGHAMARADILVINPNSNPAVTTGLDAALGKLRLADGPSIRCMTPSGGPVGLAS